MLFHEGTDICFEMYEFVLYMSTNKRKEKHKWVRNQGRTSKYFPLTMTKLCFPLKATFILADGL